jgi:hypothetical protein
LPVSATIAAAALFVAPVMLSSSASAELVTIKCGAPIGSIVKQRFNDPFTTSSATFVDVPGATARIRVPAGDKQCVTVQFFASASCVPTPSGDECFVRVVDVDNPGAFPPAVTLLSNQSTPAAHGFEWTTVLGAGSHTIKIQAATEGNAGTVIRWRLEVRVDR